MFPWKMFNRVLYRAYYRTRNGPILARSRYWTRDFLERKGPPREKGEVLVLAWGRIGDTLLSHPFLAGLNRIFPGKRITWVGRPETRFLLSGLVDRFVPFSPGEWMADPISRVAFLEALWKKWDVLAGDIHFFFGALFLLGPLVEALPAKRKFLYEGYGPPPDLAPWRPFPRSALVIPSLPKDLTAKGDPEELHVFRDAFHYISAISEAAGRGPLPLSQEETVFPLPKETGPGTIPFPGELAEGPFVALQLGSNSSRRKYPPERWREILAAFPGVRFAALGTAGEGRFARALGLPNVLDLCGRTSLEECVSLISKARAFLGLDSGLAHLAAHLRVPSLCLIQSSNLGYFLPYPEGFPEGGPAVVSHGEFRECSGCFMVCSRESLAANVRKGVPCLRSIPPERVKEALGRILGVG